MIINISGQLLDLSQPCVMGIVNMTNDSFYAGSRNRDLGQAKDKISTMIEQGAKIIDIGAFSSRPGAMLIQSDVQIKRLAPILEYMRQYHSNVIVSVDTYSHEAVSELAPIQPFIVNDISGFGWDQDLLDVVAQAKLPYILMHMRGTPQTMQSMTDYSDLSMEILNYFKDKLKILSEKGISDVILDVGIGFSKSINDNFQLVNDLPFYQLLDRPLMIGLSRKSFIYKTLGVTPDEALNGTTAMHMIALSKGAKILRVHDVKQAVETLTLWNNFQSIVNN